MNIILTIPDYDLNNGMQYNWEDGFVINVKADKLAVIIEANEAGLKSLANHLLNLAQDDVPKGHHLHFDAYNSLESDSIELTIQKL